MSLDKYEAELRKANEQRLKEAEQQIRRNFEIVLHDIIAEIGLLFAKLETDGKLTYADMAKYSRLRKQERRILEQVDQMSTKNQRAIRRLLRSSYSHSYEWMAWAIERESRARLAYAAVPLDRVDEIIEEPIGGRALKGRLSRLRKQTIDELFRRITADLVEGSNLKKMTNSVKEVLNTSHFDTVRIVRTEAHRIQEAATLASAEHATAQGVVMLKKWNSLHDQKVRHTARANHRLMDGQEVRADEDFELRPGGGKGKAPGNTGVAAHDINCRCFATYRIAEVQKKQYDELANLTFEEWRKTRLSNHDAVPRSLSAAAKKVFVKVPKSVRVSDGKNAVLKEGSYITGVLSIAEGEKIREVQRLISSYPLQNGALTSPKDWKKLRGTATVIYDGKERTAEIHWYEATNIGKIEYKVKRWFD
ncbi:phage Mu protein F [Paenibacillus sp. 32O-W]|uniref:phage minor head protein n=1 Tax=Paenibacillus sp. 32O-W TaxID=1695218 RepID=UPI00071FF4B5|nr:phage minor head protein [Paenibacillus sp. 32O-W]ALS27185.1 phage Mu protein F [Paenibacillus sp. 32O-W]